MESLVCYTICDILCVCLVCVHQQKFKVKIVINSRVSHQKIIKKLIPDNVLAKMVKIDSNSVLEYFYSELLQKIQIFDTDFVENKIFDRDLKNKMLSKVNEQNEMNKKDYFTEDLVILSGNMKINEKEIKIVLYYHSIFGTYKLSITKDSQTLSLFSIDFPSQFQFFKELQFKENSHARTTLFRSLEFVFIVKGFLEFIEN